MQTIEIADGKYAFVLDDEGVIIRDVLRHGEHWPAGMSAFQHNNCVHALIYELIAARETTKPICAECGVQKHEFICASNPPPIAWKEWICKRCNK